MTTPKFMNGWGKGSVEVGPPAPSGESRPRRLAETADKLVTTPHEGISTVYDILDYSSRTFGNRNAYGYREVVDIIEEEKEVRKMVDGQEVMEKKKWSYFHLSDYQFYTFLEIREIISEVARGLLELGLQKNDVLNIYAQTSPEWQFMSHACSAISVIVATAYDTLGESGLQHSLNEPECRAIFSNADLLPTVTKVAPHVPTLQLIIYDGKPKEDILASLRSTCHGIKVLSIQELRELGRTKPVELFVSRLPSADDVACIMYTSGTTGPPKGVVIKHSNLIAAVGSVVTLFGNNLRPSDAFLAFLPLAHILEYIVELLFVYVGAVTGYGRVKALTDTSVRNCVGDIKAFRPTLMIGVPAVWELIRKGIMSQVNRSSTLKRAAFNGAMSIKRASIPGLTSVVDAVVLSQIRAATGGRLRLALSGGSSLSKETQEFLSLALVTLLQGYGMTESCGMCAILPPEFMQLGSVGLPSPSVEIKLRDVPEAGYLHTNNPPQGEVLIRGPSVTSGYFKRDDLNNDREIFTDDGYLRTGDIGQWNKDGTLSLIDRIKNLVKLQNGEYIALERLEAIYKGCNFVSNICVHANQDSTQPIAIVIPHEQHLRHALEGQQNIDASADLSVLCHNKKVTDFVFKECNAVGKKNGLKSAELLKKVILTPDEWTPESGLVTAAHKLQRKKVAEKFLKEIKEAYKD